MNAIDSDPASLPRRGDDDRAWQFLADASSNSLDNLRSFASEEHSGGQ